MSYLMSSRAHLRLDLHHFVLLLGLFSLIFSLQKITFRLARASSLSSSLSYFSLRNLLLRSEPILESVSEASAGLGIGAAAVAANITAREGSSEVVGVRIVGGGVAAAAAGPCSFSDGSAVRAVWHLAWADVAA